MGFLNTLERFSYQNVVYGGGIRYFPPMVPSLLQVEEALFCFATRYKHKYFFISPQTFLQKKFWKSLNLLQLYNQQEAMENFVFTDNM